MEIFKLFGSIFVNTDDADKSMQKTEKNAESIAGKLGKGIKTAAKWGSGIATAATVVTGAFTGLATDAAGTADEIDKMSQKIGLSTKGYQEWAYIMGQNGMEIGKMQTGMKTLVAQMDAAAGGTASAVDNFNKLGISIYDSNGKLKDQETIMEEALYALAEMENGTEKARLATELFGKSGSEMMPMLNQGAQAMTDLKNRANELGLVLSDDVVKNGVVFGDLMDDIKQSTSMLATSLGTTLFPILIQICEAILGNMPMIQEVFSSLAPIVMQFMTALLPALIELAQAIFPILIELINQLMPFISQIAQSILPIIVQLLQMFLPPMIQIAQAILPVLGEILTALMPLLSALLPILQPLLDIIVMLIQPIAELISTILPPLIDLFSQLLEAVLPYLTEQIEILATILSGVLMGAFNALQPIIENIIGVFGGLIDFITGVFTGNWEQAWSGVVRIFSNLFNGLVNIVKAPMNAIISGINGVFNKIGTIKIPDWVPGIGGNSFSLPQLPMLEKGGTITKKGRVIVGEKAPEILDLPQGARVTPLDKVNGIDSGELKEAVYEGVASALQEMGIKLEMEVNANESKLFDSIVASNTVYKNRHGGKGALT